MLTCLFSLLHMGLKRWGLALKLPFLEFALFLLTLILTLTFSDLRSGRCSIFWALWTVLLAYTSPFRPSSAMCLPFSMKLYCYLKLVPSWRCSLLGQPSLWSWFHSVSHEFHQEGSTLLSSFNSYLIRLCLSLKHWCLCPWPPLISLNATLFES